MLTKQEFVVGVLDEFRIINHLFTTIPPGAFEYRPSANQRSTTELLQYLSIMGLEIVRAIRNGSFAAFGEAEQRAKALRPQEFPQAMERQAQQIQELLADMSDGELQESIDLFNTGKAAQRRVLLVNWLLKTLGAYKMQLFLYVKASGNPEIGTPDLWMGAPAPRA